MGPTAVVLGSRSCGEACYINVGTAVGYDNFRQFQFNVTLRGSGTTDQTKVFP